MSPMFSLTQKGLQLHCNAIAFASLGKMVLITEDLVRKRAEHNNYEISTLEEISLHQQDIEAIENLDTWCKQLKILYLQSNLISKIENVGKLKRLEYLNLALNNITKIENLSGCECLKKLDLTVNFVSELTTVQSLQDNRFFSELYLTGNPCTQFDGYREYVIATLPQLKQLDGKEIDKSERIMAMQKYSTVRDMILQQQERYKKNQEKQKESKGSAKGTKGGSRWYTDTNSGCKQANTAEESCEAGREISEEEKEKLFWSEPIEYTPESRIDVHHYIREKNKMQNQDQNKDIDPNPGGRQIKFFKDSGEPLNVNTAKMQFKLEDREDTGMYMLDVHCYKHLDTSLINVDVQPTFVRVMIKEKVLQLALPEEVNPDKCISQRSKTTGHLLIKMPKALQLISGQNGKHKTAACDGKSTHKNNEVLTDIRQSNKIGNNTERDGLTMSDLADIVKQSSLTDTKQIKNQKSPFDISNFIDDPDVPPLI